MITQRSQALRQIIFEYILIYDKHPHSHTRTDSQCALALAYANCERERMIVKWLPRIAISCSHLKRAASSAHMRIAFSVTLAWTTMHLTPAGTKTRK